MYVCMYLCMYVCIYNRYEQHPRLISCGIEKAIRESLIFSEDDFRTNFFQNFNRKQAQTEAAKRKKLRKEARQLRQYILVFVCVCWEWGGCVCVCVCVLSK